MGCAFGHLFQKRTWGTNYSDSRADINSLVTVKDMERSLENWQDVWVRGIAWAQSVMRSMSHTNGDEKGLLVKTLISPPAGSIGCRGIPATSFFHTALVHGNWLIQGQFPSPGAAPIRWLVDVVVKLHPFLQFRETLKVSKCRLPCGIGWDPCLNCTVSSFSIIKAKIPQIKWLFNIS